MLELVRALPSGPAQLYRCHQAFAERPLAEFSAAHRAAENARAEFERLREELRRASHREDLDAGL
jgi:hypothetical protein